MKITKQEFNRIIKEEIRSVVDEGAGGSLAVRGMRARILSHMAATGFPVIMDWEERTEFSKIPTADLVRMIADPDVLTKPGATGAHPNIKADPETAAKLEKELGLDLQFQADWEAGKYGE